MVASPATRTGSEPARPTAPRASIPRLALVAAGVTSLLWGSAFVVIRGVGAEFAPGPMALARVGVAALALTPLALRAGGLRGLPRGRVLLLVGLYGALWFGGYNLVLNTAERSIDAGTAAMVVNTAPILIAVGAGAFLGEGFPRPVLIGTVVAFAGVALMSLSGRGAGGLDPAGLGLALLAALLYAVSVLIQKVLLRDLDGLRATWLGAVVGTIVLLPFAPALLAALPTTPGGAVAGTVYLGLFPTAVAFLTWAYALRRLPAGRAALVGYVATLCSVLLSWAFLGEVPTAVVLAGGVLCLAGVALTRLPARSARVPEPGGTASRP
ncbi:DMT family transporter [Occultella kanbiaonis]|uniref:DMT family transporter n=1 Tax=Occultella kanbiaonis TaxID=2675754 RepID=UPI0013D14EAB|nr:DMT family transporter [Occultella kanbiaonis]